jgi:endo-1,4-beta-xylanase
MFAMRQSLVAGAIALAVLSGLGGLVCVGQERSPGAATLRQAAGDRLLIGAAVMSYQLDQPALAGLIADQFNCLTGENEFKVGPTEPRKGQFNFMPAEKILSFARQHGMKLVGHNLCWHGSLPDWMFIGSGGKPLPREQGLANLKEHIDGLVGHFKGEVIGWDVVNEAISDSGDEYLRDTPARKSIGDDYIVRAFEFAHAADPDAQLYYNDYNDEQPGKREKVLRLIGELKRQNVPIYAVGIQGHWMLKNDSDVAQKLDTAIDAFSAAGVKVMITELDVDVLPRNTSGANVNTSEPGAVNPYPGPLPADVAQAQADFYRRIFQVVNKHAGVVTRVSFWGTHDGSSWLNNWPARGRTNHPLLWDRHLQPKPAFTAVLQTLEAGAGPSVAK